MRGALKSRTQTVPHFFCLAKRNGVRPKEKRFLPALGAVEPYAGGVGGVVIPKQYTSLSIADRSLSRLRGSPLPGAGCWGLSLAQAGLSGWLRQFKSLISRRCVFSAGCCCGGFAAGARLGGCALWFLAGRLALSLALVRLSCRTLLRRLCRRCALDLAVPLGFGLGAWPRGCAADTPDIDAPFSAL